MAWQSTGDWELNQPYLGHAKYPMPSEKNISVSTNAFCGTLWDSCFCMTLYKGKSHRIFVLAQFPFFWLHLLLKREFSEQYLKNPVHGKQSEKIVN